MKFCSICGSELDNNGKCKNCGNQGSFESTLNSMVQGLSQKDYEILETVYIGNNYIGIEESKLSFSSLFFGPIYVLYRKLYLIGILWVLLIVFLLLDFSVYVALFLNLFLNILMFFMFNSIYLRIMKKKINKIVNKHPTYTLEELKKECIKSGRTNPLFIVIFGLLGILCILNYSVIPLILEKINNSTVAVNESSAESYVRTINLAIATEMLEKNASVDGVYNIEKDGSISNDSNSFEIVMGYSHPTSGEVIIQNGTVVKGEISYGKITYIYDGKISLKK